MLEAIKYGYALLNGNKEGDEQGNWTFNRAREISNRLRIMQFGNMGGNKRI